jgi:hypothetical protein
MRTQATPFNELVQFKAPDGFLAAVTAAARRDHTSISEFLRRTVLARLAEVGIPLQANEGSYIVAGEPVASRTSSNGRAAAAMEIMPPAPRHKKEPRTSRGKLDQRYDDSIRVRRRAQ